MNKIACYWKHTYDRIAVTVDLEPDMLTMEGPPEQLKEMLLKAVEVIKAYGALHQASAGLQSPPGA